MGVTIVAQTDRSAIRIVADEIQLTWEEPAGCRFVVDGVDLTDMAAGLRISFAPGAPPTIMFRVRNKADRHINESGPDPVVDRPVAQV